MQRNEKENHDYTDTTKKKEKLFTEEVERGVFGIDCTNPLRHSYRFEEQEDRRTK